MNKSGKTELERLRWYFSRHGNIRNSLFAAYRAPDVRHALEALFHGKCAYCESRYDITGPVDVEHYRPKGRIEGEAGHPGYWWLAATWTNLLPSCIDCNRRRRQRTPTAIESLAALLGTTVDGASVREVLTGKGDCFPLSGTRISREPELVEVDGLLAAEAPLLLDPCSDDPSKHITFHIDRYEPLGIVYSCSADASVRHLPHATDDILEVGHVAALAGISARGAVSIQVFGLNRLKLIQERTRILRKLEFLGDTVVELASNADELERVRPGGDELIIREVVERLRKIVNRTMAEIRDMAAPGSPFSAMVAAWINEFIKGELKIVPASFAPAVPGGDLREVARL